MSGEAYGPPSEAAVGHAQRRYPERSSFRRLAALAVEDAHDPALGAERSVCLRDVCEALVAALPHEVDENDAAGVVELLMERFTGRPNA